MTVLALTLAIMCVVLAAVTAVLVLGRQSDRQAAGAIQQQLESVRAQTAEGLRSASEGMDRRLAALTEQLNAQLASVNSNLTLSQKAVGERLDGTARMMGEVQRGLGELAQSSVRIMEIGKSMSELQDILRAPKLRGSLGELLLADLLAQVLPAESYALQKTFSTGESVDAVVRLAQGMIPIDAKFPLENFRRIAAAPSADEQAAARKKAMADVKKHVDSIARKYILPDEGTLDFALMYIPAENVYYEAVIRDVAAGEETGLSAYALERRVIPVSPNTLFAYLQAIALGLKGMAVERNARAIVDLLGRLSQDFGRFRKEFDILGTHLVNARGKYEETLARLDRFGDRLSAGAELPAPPVGGAIDRPL